MRKRRRVFGVILMIVALVIMTIPVTEADAASASDFVMDGKKLTKYIGVDKKVTIPDTVEVIGESAFEGKTAIEQVVIPDSVKKIDPYAFWNCESLKTVTLGKGLTAIDDYAFTKCVGLEKINLPSNIKSIGIQAFADCVNLKEVTIPPETTSIYENAFDGCAKVQFSCASGSYGEKFAADFLKKKDEMAEYEDVPGYGREDTPVATIQPTPMPTVKPAEDWDDGKGEYDGITKVYGSTRVVGNHALVMVPSGELFVVGSKNDSNVTVNEQEKPSEEKEVTSEKKEETIPQNNQKEPQTENKPEEEIISKYTIVDKKIVADQAYYHNKELRKVVLPEGIEEIGQFSFARSTVTGVTLPDTLKKISYGAFYHCDNLKEVEIPNSVECVEPKAFTYTKWLEDFGKQKEEDFLISGGVLVAYQGSEKKVILPQGVRVIAAEVFQGHDEIESIVFPNTLKVIGEAAFSGCTKLKELKLNQGLEKIKDRAFFGSKDLTVTLPSSVKEIGLLALPDASIIYEGAAPVVEVEDSAKRLSNESYRGVSASAETPGVLVQGVEGAKASLEGASRAYQLVIKEMNGDDLLQKAWNRVYHEYLPKDKTIYSLKLMDQSNIPIEKLGRQNLNLYLPVTSEQKGKKLVAVGLDRNSQLQSIFSEKVMVDGKEMLRIQMNQISAICILTDGVEQATERKEVSFVSQAMPREEKDSFPVTTAKNGFGVSLLTVSFLLIGMNLGKGKKQDS